MMGRRAFLKLLITSSAGLGLSRLSGLPAWRQARAAVAATGEDRVYLMSYFRTEAEALHLAYSPDGYHWTALNGNQPVLESSVGSHSIRDPFIVRGQDGGYHLIWTDGWSSDHIGYCRSDDLIHWGEQKLLPVMAGVKWTKNCWAPECFYDPEAKEYRFIWSSTVFKNDLERFLDVYDHRIWTTTTRDFATFSLSSLYFDPGYSVIDATLVYDETRRTNRYVMIFKDERGENRPGTENKAMRVTVAGSGDGPFHDISELITPTLTEGPTVFRMGDRWMMFYDHFMEGRFGASISDDLLHWEIVTDQVTFPPGPRHATVFPVEQEALDALLEAYPEAG